MYSLAYNLFQKEMRQIFKATNLCCVGEFLSFKYVFLISTKLIYGLFLIVHQKSLKNTIKPGYSVHNNHLNLCGQIEKSKWILCSLKRGVKCGY